MKWSGTANPDYHSHIQSTWEKLLFPSELSFTAHWNESLHNGVAEIIFELDKYPENDVFVAAKRMFKAAGVTCREYKSSLAE